MAKVECPGRNMEEVRPVDEKFIETVNTELWHLVPTIPGLCFEGKQVQLESVQETEIKLLPHLPMLTKLPEGKRRSYLRRSLCSAYIDYCRDQQKQDRHEEPFNETLMDYRQGPSSTLNLSYEVIEALGERLAIEAALETLRAARQEALAKLKPPVRMVYELREGKGWSFQKIATHLGKSKPVVFRAWQKAHEEVMTFLVQLRINI